MAFNFGASNPAGGSASAELGSELPDVFTDEVGFKGVSGDANIRFLPTAWPDNALPAPTSSLLAVAHTKGLVVGAGPDALVISTTDVVRKSIEAPAGEDMEKTKPFQPIATIPLPSRPTHVAFTPGDDGLILATENGPAISVFDTNALTQGNAQPAISIPTNGVSLRALAPNPDPSSTLVALVTMNGELLIADLKAGSLLPGPNGPVLKDGVSCASWSNKGKQLVAGLADGTGYQMTPDGTKKAEVPRPSDLEGDCHISSIAWLENDVFFVTYTPNISEDDMGMNPASSYYIITRRKQAPFLIQKLPEVCSTMGFMLKRGPAYQFITRIREYKPHLRDVLIVASTASTDLGLITRSDQPLANDDRTKSHVGQFMTTEVSDDTKRASVPLKESGDETSVIGLAQNLSATENVVAPLPGSDILESSTPLPGVLLLNNDGILSSWWFVYADSIRQNIPYSGLISSGQATQAPSQPQAVAPTPAPAPAQQPAFGQSSFGAPSPFGQPAFGKPAGAPAFGSPSAMGASTMGATAFGKQSAPAFGSPSRLGGSPSPAFGKTSSPAPAPAFGTPSQPGASFGTPSTPGQPQFGKSGFGTMGSGFGQSSSPANPFGAKAVASGGGFSSFSGGGGFSGFATAKPSESPFAAKQSGGSPFAAKQPGESPFAATQSKGSPFGNASAGESAFAKSSASPFGAKPQAPTSFPPPASSAVKNPFGAAQGGFELKSTFKGDGSAANDLPKADKPSPGAFSFGGSFDEMVSTSRKGSSSPSESMDDTEDIEPVNKETFSIFGGARKPASETPTSMFSSKTQFSKTTTPAENTKSAFSMFGTTADQNRVTSPLSALSDKTETPKKNWPSTSSIDVEAPLPPDPITRASYAAGDTSASSSKCSAEDAPLPPDFTKAKKPSPKPEDDAPLPPDFLSKKKSAPTTDDAPLPPDFLTKKPAPKTEDAPLPPDFLTKKLAPKTEDAPLPPDFLTQKKSVPKADDAPLPPDFLTKPKKSEAAVIPEDAPLPPDFTAKPKTKPFEEAIPIPDESDESGISDGDSEAADESDFSDSGEEITHDEAFIAKSKQSAQSSFGAVSAVSEQSSTGGFFSSPARNADDKGRLPRQLFGEIPKQPLLPPPGPVAQGNREPYRSPSPVRIGGKKNVLFSERPHTRKGSTGALHSRKASLTHIAQRDGRLRKASDVAREEQEKQARAHAAAQLQEDDVLSLSDDDEDDRLRDELAQPVEPVDTLDPFLPHQNYMGETAKPGIAGQVERLCRDINSMVDTLGINARSMAGFLLHQQPKKPSDIDDWVMVLNSDQPAEILDKKMTLKDIESFEELIASIAQSLENQRVQGVDEKLDACRDLLTKQVVTLRGQFASIRKTLDAHTDVGAILEAPLSAEQGALQHDLRTTFTNIQVNMAALEQAVSLLRAKIADVPQANGTGRNRPTVEAVTKTIATMMSMAEGKSTDIDVLEAQMRKLGVDIAPTGPPSREASPFSTPRKNVAGRIPMTPGSRGSIDGSAYHTPDSVSRGLNFRASINGSVRQSRLRSVEGAGEPALPQEDAVQYKAKKSRRQHLNGNLKKAFEDKQVKVRGVDDW
ncbi:Nuclear pore complex protein [Penicillium expansum]|uniref:Nuclear pore complex protein n=1 Tax=Penicillium expansum TaxID=27334 RepID=A0A0A2K4C5_PENEN|nr:Nuclear pore complex protein [Penicillium expansum]KGO61916.1 Nuclear pore complex protein [Penicillium expansum]